MPEDKRKKILFVIPSLAGGGAERMLIYLLQYLNRELFRPVLVIFNPKKGAYDSQVPADVATINLHKKGPLDFFRLISQLSRIIRKEQPEFIVSFLTYANYLSLMARSCSRLKIPVILSEQNVLSKSLGDERFNYIKRRIIRWFYPKAEKVVAISQGVKNDLIKKYFPFPDRISVIYNSIDMEKISALAGERVGRPYFASNIPIIISAGRLTTQKNYPLLLRATAKLREQLDFNLAILGEGEERNNLEELARRLNIENRVAFLGFQENPFKYMAKADVFVLSSSWEGFGNVIIEAMACGAPVISTRCPSGPDEIITDGVNGLLVPVGDVDALSEAILRLLKDEPFRKQLAVAGRKRAEDFRVEKMTAEYERVFEEAASGE